MVKQIIKIISYFYRNFFLPRFLSFKYKKILAENRLIKNVYQDKRCFIIASGPSVARLNLSRLKNEHTIVFNEFDKLAQAKELTPTYYVFADTFYFTEAPDHYLTQQFLNKQNVIDPKTEVVIHAFGKDFVESNNLFRQHRIRYVLPHGIMSNHFRFNIDLDRVVPLPKNSVIMGIMLAVYAGFKEVYLLGCEHSFLAQPIGLGKSLTYQHAYSSSLDDFSHITDRKTARRYYVGRDLDLNYEANVAHILQLFKNYRLLKEKLAKEKLNVRIFNATPNSFLDVFPMINFEDIEL